MKLKIVLLCILIFFSGAATTAFFARQYPEHFNPHIEQALQECISEIQNGCPMLLGYAKSLESENARLNRILKTTCLPNR